MDTLCARLEMQNSQAHQEKEKIMYDIFATILLADHFSRRYRPVERQPVRPEPESPWSRVFAWHRRNNCE